MRKILSSFGIILTLTASSMKRLRHIIVTILFMVFFLIGPGAYGVDTIPQPPDPPPIHDTLEINVNVGWENPRILVTNEVTTTPDSSTLKKIDNLINVLAEKKEPPGNAQFIVNGANTTVSSVATAGKHWRTVSFVAGLFSLLLLWFMLEYEISGYDKRHLLIADIIKILSKAMVIAGIVYIVILLIASLVIKDLSIIDLIRP